MSRLSGRLARVGLRWRLAAGVVAVTLLCTGITFVAVYRGTGTQVRRQIESEIAGDAGQLAHNLQREHPRTPARVWAVADDYVHDQPFAAGSTLLFAVVPGVGMSTNRPELFSQPRAARDEAPAAQAREARLSARLLRAGAGYSTLALPEVGELRLLKRVVVLPGGSRVTIGAGEPLSAVARAQSGVARAFILAGLLAIAGALLASYAIGTRVSLPLRRMAAVAGRVNAGDLEPRIQDASGQSREVRVLTEAFNLMLDRLTEAFAGQRAFVADASHELRTPLTVIRGQVELLAAQREPAPEEVRRVEHLVRAEIDRITRLVDDLLVLVKMEQPQFLRPERVALREFVHELWDGATPLAKRRFELETVPAGTLQGDPDRIAQALRNLLANAIEHTTAPSGLVRLRVQAHGAQGERVRFTVEDDGTGIAPEERERVFDRFYRTDDARDRASGGTGLGLAIVRAIAQAHGGSAKIYPSQEGGASVELELPGFELHGTSTAAPVKRPARRSSSASPAASRG